MTGAPVNAVVPGRRPRTTLELLEDLVPRIDRLVRAQELALERSSEAVQLFRGGQTDGVLFTGTVQTANLEYRQDFTVPFAAVTLADVADVGPLFASNDGSEGQMGPGLVRCPANSFITAPLTGRSLLVRATSAGALLLVVWGERQPFAMGAV